MPASYEIDRERRLILNRAWGVLTADDLRVTREKLQDDPEFQSDFAQLFDLRDVTEIAISSTMMGNVASSSVFLPGVRRAFVTGNAMQFGMARMFAAHAEIHRQQVRVFREMSEALAWLGEPADD